MKLIVCTCICNNFNTASHFVSSSFTDLFKTVSGVKEVHIICYVIVPTIFFKFAPVANIPISFHLKGARKSWLRVHCFEKNKTLSVLSMTLNCISWWGSYLGIDGMWITPSLPLLSGSHWPRVVVPVWVLSMGLIELFNHLLRIIIIIYLKLYSCVQIVCIR